MPFKISEVEGCNGCPMQRLFPDNHFVSPKLNNGLRLAIAEAPGEQESIEGAPLVGGSGSWLRGAEVRPGIRKGGLYAKAGVREDEVSYGNCIQCRPPDNIFPTDPEARKYISKEDAQKAIDHCFKAHVQPLLFARPWKRIDILGDKPLRLLCGKTEGIMKWRGSPLPITALTGSDNTPLAIPTLHPAYIARDQAMLPAVVSDLKKSLYLSPEYYNTHPSLTDVQNFTAKEFVFDIETNGWSEEITMVGLCSQPYKVIVVPFRGAYIAELKRIFRNATSIIGQNIIQFDIPILFNNGILLGREDGDTFRGVDSIGTSSIYSGASEVEVWDIMLMQHLLQPDLPHDLEFLGSIFASKAAWKHDKASFETYCARDCDVTLQAFTQLKPLLEKEGLTRLYQLVQIPLGRICYLMHKTGFKVDPARLIEVRAKLKEEMVELEKGLPIHLRTTLVAVNRRQPAPEGTISPKTGKPLKFTMYPVEEEEIPWRSGDVVQKWLYEELQLPKQLHAKTEQTTVDKTALVKLISFCRRMKQSEFVPGLLALGELRKRNTLLTAFCKEKTTKAERLYPHFNVHGTNSGRLSSSDPNFQNQPPSARYMYVPSLSGWSIVEADFLSIENRLTAWFANDIERLKRLSEPGFNEHRWVASRFFNIPYEDVVKDNDKDAPYGKAKRINHGANYGMGAKKIANMYDMDFQEVKGYLVKLKSAMPKTTKWQVKTGEEAHSKGVLTTPFSRKRWFYTSSYYTEALSFLPQSTAADIIYRAMLGLMYQRIGWPEYLVKQVVDVYIPLPEPARLLLQVHDSLVLECPTIMVPEIVGVIKTVMEQPWKELGGFSIPVEVKVGDSWGEVQKYAS